MSKLTFGPYQDANMKTFKILYDWGVRRKVFSLDEEGKKFRSDMTGNPISTYPDYQIILPLSDLGNGIELLVAWSQVIQDMGGSEGTERDMAKVLRIAMYKN